LFIRLDNKSRLVLPLLLRDKLGISNGGPKQVRIKIVSANIKLAVVEVSNSEDVADALPFSKNGKEVKK